ncbi:hypothetical protein Q757_08120, partial [Oenococcus alcoholitolerans]
SQKLADDIDRLKSGQKSIMIPEYSLAINDIVAGRNKTVMNSDILLIEGVTAFRLPEYDFAIYLDADKDLISNGLSAKTSIHFTKQERSEQLLPSIYQLERPRYFKNDHRYLEKINLKNLETYIEPYKGKADLTVIKGQDHKIIKTIKKEK